MKIAAALVVVLVLALVWMANLVRPTHSLMSLLVVVGLPVAGLIVLRRCIRAAASRRRQRDMAQAFPQFRHAHLHNGTGIGVHPELGVLRLLCTESHRRIVKDYRFADIRGFERVVLSGGGAVPGQAVAVNLTSAMNASLANMAVARHNVAVARRNQDSTGIFVTAKDVDHPRWRIAFEDERGMDRWMEILRQTLSD